MYTMYTSISDDVGGHQVAPQPIKKTFFSVNHYLKYISTFIKKLDVDITFVSYFKILIPRMLKKRFPENWTEV
jgi:hypothetical protein